MAGKSSTPTHLPGNRSKKSQPQVNHAKTKKNLWVLGLIRETQALRLRSPFPGLKQMSHHKVYTNIYHSIVFGSGSPEHIPKETVCLKIQGAVSQKKPPAATCTVPLQHSATALFLCSPRQKILRRKKEGRRFRNDLQFQFHVSATD